MTVHVEIRGTGPDVVLLHGWALHGGMWGPWLGELEKHARLHVLDLPGHGRSAWPAGVRDLAGLARAVYPHLPRESAVLGWSLGGMVALELARRHPQQVSALVLIATTPKFLAGNGWEHGMRAALLGEFAQGLASDHARTVQDFLALQARGDERSSESLRMLRRQLAAHGAPDIGALEAGLAILRDADLRDELPRIAQPTLVIAGEHDRLTPPEAGLELARAMPAARYRLIGRSGHAPFLSHGPEVLSEVTGFLARHAAPGSAGVLA